MSGALRAWRRILLPAGFAVVSLLAWQYGVVWAKLRPNLLVPPSEIWRVTTVAYPLLMRHAVPTALQLVLSFAAAVAVGFGIGAALTGSKRLRQAIYPHIVLFQLMPKVAVAPLFIIWLGVGPISSVAFAVFLGFFPMLIATIGGLTNTDGDSLRLCRSLTATPWQTFRYVRLAYALPYLFDGMKLTAIMSLTGLIVGEFVAAQSGLGYLVLFAASIVETGLMFAAIGLLSLIGLALYGAIALAQYLVMRRLGIPPLATGFVET
jgi:NitT/TauT family transport system permease protein